MCEHHPSPLPPKAPHTLELMKDTVFTAHLWKWDSASLSERGTTPSPFCNHAPQTTEQTKRRRVLCLPIKAGPINGLNMVTILHPHSYTPIRQVIKERENVLFCYQDKKWVPTPPLSLLRSSTTERMTAQIVKRKPKSDRKSEFTGICLSR